MANLAYPRTLEVIPLFNRTPGPLTVVSFPSFSLLSRVKKKNTCVVGLVCWWAGDLQAYPEISTRPLSPKRKMRNRWSGVTPV